MRPPPVPGNLDIKPPALVAHRGYALRYPENTMESLRAAIRAGACYVEFDVQLTADRVPVVIHDPSLWRTGRVDGNVLDMTIDQVMQVEVAETARLGPEYTDVHIPTLEDVVALLREHPRVTGFVEIKRESLRRFGTDDVVEKIMETVRPGLAHCVVISFDLEAIRRARELGAAIGWVLDDYTPQIRTTLEELRPEYVFCNYRIVPSDGWLWPGPWRWALYEIVDPELAIAFAAHGAQLIETMAIKEMLSDRRLMPGSCHE